ncbi:hypothetical protein ACE1SV_08020 [Streptomyces sennicomposti]
MILGQPCDNDGRGSPRRRGPGRGPPTRVTPAAVRAALDAGRSGTDPRTPRRPHGPDGRAATDAGLRTPPGRGSTDEAAAGAGPAVSAPALGQQSPPAANRTPAVTSVITGPRTTGQLTSRLQGAVLLLDDAVLDRIDAIVPPGTGLCQPDGVWRPPSLTERARRRRPAGERAAADRAVGGRRPLRGRGDRAGTAGRP